MHFGILNITDHFLDDHEEEMIDTFSKPMMMQSKPPKLMKEDSW